MNWPTKTWAEVLTIKNGKNQKNVVNAAGDYPIYGSGRGVMGYADDYLCNEGTTIIGRKGSINKPRFINEKFWNVDTAFGLVPGDSLDNKFFYYFCTTYNFLKHNKATTLPSLTKADLLKIKIPLPPLPLQKKIAAILDAADAYRQKTKALIAKYEELAQSLFLDMFGDPNLFEHHAISKIAAKEKYALSSGPFGSNLTSKHYTENGVMVLRGTNVTSGSLDLSNIKYVSEEKAVELKRSELKPGDVVIVAVGSSGKAFKIPSTLKRAVMSQNFNKITPDKSKATSVYLEFCFNSQLVQNQFKREMTDTVRTFLSLTKIKEVIIPLPKIELQLLFEERVEAIETQKHSAHASLAKAEDLFNSLLQRAFKGELTN